MLIFPLASQEMTDFQLPDVFCFTDFLSGFIFRVKVRVRGGFRVRVRVRTSVGG